MKCQKCQQSFNKQNRKPVELPCKHFCCFKCVYKMKKSKLVICPEDQQEYSPQDKFTIKSEIIDNRKEEIIKAETINIISERISRLSESFDHNFKIITLGSTFTGKTSILQKYFKNLFGKTTPTITVDFFTKNLKSENKNIIVTAYDTAGSENFKSMTSKYVKDKHCILLIFDITQRKTFQDLNDWLDWANQLKQDKAFYILVGTKLDLENEREVDKKEAQQWATQNDMPYFEVSSKYNVNINNLFQHCIKNCLDKFKDEQNDESDIFHVEVKEKKKRGCFDWFRSIFK